ncbi:polysaccharide deacetylase family protein [Geomonas propionica]|uniref:Polysaccharide deacetylase family protein n=1 Tax=Geomonas propionica TaxID=2798582 RepID=A0ABS0YU06_9BACT|nr:polysaccharide deacetylase family protein [Geomonas propionica]MBJ6801409.1 polysaccharide deacetylase family protein [Geomonas propionica]
MFLVVTIDTEEDNWGQYTDRSYSLKNLLKLHELQTLFDRYGVRPTYLINYPVATDPLAIELFSHFLAKDSCEIGMHCHPWNTPPYEESLCSFNSMLCNLPEELQYRKLKTLRDAIRDNFGVTPVSFRAGRWAFGSSTARSIQKLGLKIDTSVTSYTDWGGNGVDYSAVPPRPYRFSSENILASDDSGELLQYPASVGFLQPHFDICSRAHELLRKNPLKQMRLCGLLDRLRLLNKVALSPETASGKSMVNLAKRFERLGINYLNLFFHSNSLVKGLSPFNRSDADTRRFFESLEQFLHYARERGMERSVLKEVRLGDFCPCGRELQSPDRCCGASRLPPQVSRAGVFDAEARRARAAGFLQPRA